MTEESAVKVCVRVRPLIEREENAASEDAEPLQFFWKADKKSIQQIDDGNSAKSFSFDRVFTADETTNQLYQNIAKPLVVSTVNGYNGTIFAYGQTSSGKTFTMMGSNGTPGVIPLAVEDVFQTIKNCPKKEFLLRVSYMEIYNETVTDLLVDSWKRKPLEVRETINKNIYVADLTEELVTSPAQALAWIRKGEKNRHYGKTKMNQRSSRSHTIFRMILESRERSDPVSGENADGAIIVSHLNLVDLAGSERASQTGAEGARFKEGCNINRSLFTLGQVIKKLTDESQKGFTNYRDSKLTRILQNSLGGNAKTVIICTITPVALDETLSTLQFASTAKKMKNDPHVTEVSDDGALLKRYRNEIVDLKRRLQEVSSVTQTTATEKEVLSQLLQEKDQLQREQEDRIRNLTQLLVTSSNQITAPKMPKRRVTWGGKMLRLAHRSAFEGGMSDLSFADPFSRKRKADRSCLSELAGDDEDFHWEVPDELPEDMEINQSSVTVRSFGDSPKDFVSPDRMHELSGKVSNLELQLELEVQQKEEAVTKAETLEGRVSELEQQLQTESQQKRAALEAMEMLEVRVSDLERQLEEQSHGPSNSDEQMRQEFERETIQLCEQLASEKDMIATERDYLRQELGMFMEQIESLEKEKATISKELDERRETDEFKSLEEEFRKEHENELQNEISSLKSAVEAAELQRLELQKKLEALSEELKKKSDFAEELQNMSGKDLVQEVAKLRRSLDDAEGVSRDTKKDWAHLRSQNIALEEANVSLAKNHEKMEAEVKSLRSQLEAEKSHFRQMQSDLQRELNVVFDENTKLTTLLDGKVPKNLIDSVELERTVANLNKELTASREVEVTLTAQLEELAHLRTLPDKVDHLMQQVCELTEELCATQTQRDGLMSAQTQSQDEARQLSDALQTSQEEITNVRAELSAAVLKEEQLLEQMELLRQVLENSEAEKSQLNSAVEEKHSKLTESEEQRESLTQKLSEMQQLVKDLEEKLADSEVSRATEEEISKELQEQLNQLTEELQVVQAEKDALLNDGAQSSAEETEKLLRTVTAEREELRTELQKHEEMAAEAQTLLQSLQTELQERQEQKSDLEKLYEQKESELGGRIESLSAELQGVQVERETLLTGAQTSAEEREKLLLALSSLTEERDQLKMDMQENVEMMIENQEELRTALERNNQQKELIKQLEAAKTSKHEDPPPSDTSAQLEELQTQKEQLQAELQTLRDQKSRLEEDLQRNVETAAETQSLLDSLQLQLQEQNQRNSDLETLSQERQTELEQQLAETERRLLSLEEELQQEKQNNSNQMNLCEHKESDIDQKAAETQSLLDSLQLQLQEQNQRNSDLKTLSQERQAQMEQQMKTLSEQLTAALAERDAALLDEKTSCQSSSEEIVKLQDRVASLSEDRDQLQETLEALRQEKQQLREEMEERMEMMQVELQQQQFSSEPRSLREEQDAQQLLQIQQLEENLEKSQQEMNQLKSDLQENVEQMIETQEELRVSQEKIRGLQDEIDVMRREKSELESNQSNGIDKETILKIQELRNQIQTVAEQLQNVESERDALLQERTAESQTHSEDRDQLQDRVASLSEDRDQLQNRVASLSEDRDQLQNRVASLSEDRDQLQDRVASLSEDRDQLQETLEALRHGKQQLKEEMEDRMDALQTEVAQLNMTVQTLMEKKSELEEELQQNMNTASTTQELLKSVQEELQEQKEMNSKLEKESQEKESTLDKQMKTLTEELQTVSAERDNQIKTLSEQLTATLAERDTMLFEKETSCLSSSEEMEKLQQRVASLSEDRDQLQDRVASLSQDRDQLQDRVASLSQDRDQLQDRVASLSQDRDQVQDRVASLSQDRDQLQDRVASLSQNRDQLQDRVASLSQDRDQLQDRVASLSQDRDQLQDRVASLSQDRDQLQDRVASLSQDRDQLQDRVASLSEDRDQLQDRVASLSQDRDQLQETLEALRHEKQQLLQSMEDRIEALLSEISALQGKLSELEAEREEKEAQLQQQVQQLERKLRVSLEKHTEADSSQQLLNEANKTISALKDQLSSLDQSSSRPRESAASRLQESTDQLQEWFRKFQLLIDMGSNYNSAALNLSPSRDDCRVALPKSVMDAYKSVSQLEQHAEQALLKIIDELYVKIQDYRTLFEELVKKDLDVFEERRLQDVLLCRAQAPTYSLNDEDFSALWEQRLTELLDKRKLYLQKMEFVWGKLFANMKSFRSGVNTEITERERYFAQLEAALGKKPRNHRELEAILSREQDKKTAMIHSSKTTLQAIIDEHSGLFAEMKLLQTQANSQLREEKSRRSTLLLPLEGAPLKTEPTLLKENQQLVLQLQQTKERVQVLCAEKEQLEEAQMKTNNRLSNHIEATQLLQTELQDSRAQVEEKENMIHTLKSKLRESEKNASPSAAEMEKLRTKLFKMEVELTSASDKHQQEIQRMTSVLKEKEESLRKLKETLRKSQQQGEESFLQGEDLHARLTNPRGFVIKTSIQQEKTKLEEEVKQLKMKITELEGLVSSQQAEISKWKSRAVKLKAKNKADADKPSPPCTPTKRGFPVTADSSNFYSSPKKFVVTPRKVLDSPRKVLDSPRKLLGSPNVSLLGSPKSRFFDVGVSSELLSKSRPKQFFDNSSLGTVPDASVSADKKDEWWPQSPKQEEMCKTQ
ncbi:centromere-associated protein E isoform X2 [Cheilinus undulatus]|uniref:centromere-associated protein E isoform X2 n=1 Tax=Cheilinus undulatus TaxID=241271 RepID=UPI001BD28D1C|nr:centromere-associated protein E isoform X2 [Cheilinus undulatus]